MTSKVPTAPPEGSRWRTDDIFGCDAVMIVSVDDEQIVWYRKLQDSGPRRLHCMSAAVFLKHFKPLPRDDRRNT